MNGRFLRHWLAPMGEIPRPQRDNFGFRVGRMGLVIAFCLILPTFAAAQNAPGVPPSADAQKCAALAELNLEGVPGGPAFITSARRVEVPASGLEQWILSPSRFASSGESGSRTPRKRGNQSRIRCPGSVAWARR